MVTPNSKFSTSKAPDPPFNEPLKKRWELCIWRWIQRIEDNLNALRVSFTKLEEEVDDDTDIEAGDTYDGYFKCVLSEDGTSVAVSAGEAIVNDQKYSMSSQTISLGASTAYIIFRATTTQAMIQASDTYDYVALESNIILCTFDEDGNVVQEQHGQIDTIIVKECP